MRSDKLMPIYVKKDVDKDHSFTNFPVTISNNVKSSVSSWSVEGNGEQQGTPTPDNIIMPTFCGVRTGNLFDSAVYELVPVSASAQRKGTNLGVLPQGTYTFNAVSAASATPIYRTVKNGNTYTFEAINALPYTFTADGVSEQIIRTSGTQGNTWEDVGYSSIMLNLGSTALPYEPYGWAEKITCAGQTVPVYLGQTPTVRRVKKLVLTGDENWYINGSVSTEDTAYFYTTFLPSNTYVQGRGICTHFEYKDVYNNRNIIGFHLVASYGGLRFRIMQTIAGTIADFKAYLVSEYAAGTPVTVWYVLANEQTGIVNEPLAKIRDYADELLSTSEGTPQLTLSTEESNIISFETDLQPSKFNIKYYEKDYTKIKDIQMQIPTTKTYKSIKYVLDNNNNYVYKSPYFYTWEGIREIVRAGKASQYYPIGSIIYDNFNESTGTAFQVVAYDNHFDPTLTAQGYTHSMTLCELLLTDVITFDAQEAFLYTEVDIPAGTYKFTIPNYDATYGGNKTYYFTSTTTLPSGSQIVMNWPYQQTPKTVTGYVGPNPQTNTTALSGFSALTLTEWVDGTSPEATDLGTIAGPTTQLGTSNYGQMNHIHRVRYGSNNYLQSGIRQYINSNSAANTWWAPQTVFDRPYGSRSSAGRLTKLNQDLVSVMATPEIKSRTNSYFETTSLDGTTFTLSTDYTINTDKMFLLSPMEVNFNTTDTTIGTTLNYYVGANNDKRIKIRKSNNTAYYWWLRTPYPSTASGVRSVNTSGALNNYYANGSIGAAPACVIQ